MVTTADLIETISAHREWLLVRQMGRSSAVLASEIEIEDDGGRRRFTFVDDAGIQVWRLEAARADAHELELDLTRSFGRHPEVIRLIPRTPAAELSAEVTRARLAKANEIAALVKTVHKAIALGRVALNQDNGRIAQIEFEHPDGRTLAAMADVTSAVTAEMVLATAIVWLERLGERRKKPIKELWLVCEKRQARGAQKLLALLTRSWQAKISILEINRRSDPSTLTPLPVKRVSDLWRDRAPKLVLPISSGTSVTAAGIAALDPAEIDLIFSRQGETLRYNGLPFARVRTIMGAEKAWFGTGRERLPLLSDHNRDLRRLIEELRLNRSPDAPNKRHRHYRFAPEAWLESILRRNIKLLDPNLLLSPIYNQFRSANDKIDLLTLRRDGRLVIIELKTQPDRAGIFQAAGYWRKIELQRRRGILQAANLFDGRVISDQPALVYFVAPAWSFHREFEFFARCLAPEIELWRFELHEEWRRRVRVLARVNYDGRTYL